MMLLPIDAILLFAIIIVIGINTTNAAAFVDSALQIQHRYLHQRHNLIRPLNLKKGGTKKKKVKSNTITVNKLAFRNYEVLEKWEAGISLVGTEVKR